VTAQIKESQEGVDVIMGFICPKLSQMNTALVNEYPFAPCVDTVSGYVCDEPLSCQEKAWDPSSRTPVSQLKPLYPLHSQILAPLRVLRTYNIEQDEIIRTSLRRSNYTIITSEGDIYRRVDDSGLRAENTRLFFILDEWTEAVSRAIELMQEGSYQTRDY